MLWPKGGSGLRQWNREGVISESLGNFRLHVPDFLSILTPSVLSDFPAYE